MNPVLALPLLILVILACFGVIYLLIRLVCAIGAAIYDFLDRFFGCETAYVMTALIFISTLLGGLLWMGWMEAR